MAKQTLIIGHRGAPSSAAENTIMSYLLAFMQGADAIEADIRLTADGHLVAVHDEDLKRTGNRALKVEKSSLEKVRMVDVGKNGYVGSRGQKVPTLEEVMALVPKDKRLLLDLKSGEESVPVLAKQLKAGPLKPEQVVICSSEPGVLLALQAELPKWERMLVCQRRQVKASGEWMPTASALNGVAKSVGAKGVALDFRGVSVESAVVREVQAAGLQVLVWTVNRIPNARKCQAWGADGIITDYPGRLLKNLREGESETGAGELLSGVLNAVGR
jgi:glycerophosphoryl diester phosphodiesterase